MLIQSCLSASALLALAAALPASPAHENRAGLAPTVQLSYATVVGSPGPGVNSFKGIPFAKPPVGDLRLRAPQSIDSNLGTINAVGSPRACPQFYTQVNASALPLDVSRLVDSSFGQAALMAGEDCLTLNVQVPASATPTSRLPVVFWIYGGGFEFGSTQTYDATQFILNSVAQGKPIVYVAVNYRLGGFGFLPGSEVSKAGIGNLGLLDQRKGLEWVADNIAKFGTHTLLPPFPSSILLLRGIREGKREE